METFGYPDAAKILAEQHITLKAGDGNIRFAECTSESGLVWVTRMGAAPDKLCFKVTGPSGYLALEIADVINIKGDDHTIKATLSTAGATSSVDIAKNAWTPVGQADVSGGSKPSTLVELVASDGSPATVPTPEVPAVGSIAVGAAGRADSRGCTGTLVDPLWVLTSAGCFTGNPATLAAGAPVTKSTFTAGGRSTDLVELVPRADRDTALARLAAPISDITPARFATAAATSGSGAKIVGFGRTATTWWNAGPRTTNQSVGTVSATGIDLTPAVGAAPVCAGDAGAPLLNTAGEITGVVSRAWQAGCLGTSANETRTAAQGVRIDDIRGWIGQLIDGINGARIPAGTTLASGDSLTSASNRLTMQADGNLVVSSKAGKTLWSSNTAGTPGATATLQGDGNLVVRRTDGSTAWQSATSGNASGYAVLQDRGNLVVYNAKAQSVWAAGTEVRHDDNGDGRSDLTAWYNYSDGHDALHTLAANADGSFNGPFQSFSAPAGWYYVENMKFATGDYNGDGRSDTAALYCYGDGSVRLYTGLGKPDGGIADLTGSWSSPAGNWYCANMTLESGDFNGDGRDDVMAWYAYGDGSDRAFTLTADAKGGFNAPTSSLTLPAGWWEVAQSKFVTGDFNGDGRDDLAALYGYADGSVKMYTFLTDPAGGFLPGTSSWSGTAASWGDFSRTNIHAGDFNGDGRDDVAFWYDYADGADALYTLTARPDGGFNAPFRSWAADPGNWYLANMKFVPGDYDGDGREDLAAMYGYGDGSVRMFTWRTGSDGGFTAPLASWSATPGNWWIASSTFLKPYNTTSTG